MKNTTGMPYLKIEDCRAKSIQWVLKHIRRKPVTGW